MRRMFFLTAYGCTREECLSMYENLEAIIKGKPQKRRQEFKGPLTKDEKDFLTQAFVVLKEGS